MNIEFVIAGVLLLLIVGVLVYQYVKKSKSGVVAKVGAEAVSLEQKVAALVGKHLASNPSDTPPPAAPVAPVSVVVTQSDAVAAKHAQLDALIAAGLAAQAQKDALTAKQAELEALVS